MKCSRSEIYSRALAEFIGHRAPERLTELMNEVIHELADKEDSFVEAAARQVLKRAEW